MTADRPLPAGAVPPVGAAATPADAVATPAGAAATPADAAAPALAPEPPADDLAWRRMHPVTPAVKGWKVLVAVLAVLAWNAADDVRQLAELLGGRAWLVIVGAIVLITLIGFGYSAIAWRMTRFAVTDDAVHLRSGVVFRQQRQARLDRLQAVDVVQPLLARIIGLSELRLEVAGGAGSGVSLAFLREAEAEQLRAELLARAAGLHRGGRPRPAVAGSTPAGPAAPQAGPAAPPLATTAPDAVPATGHPATPDPDAALSLPVEPDEDWAAAPVAPERPVYEVPVGRLLLSTLLSSATIWLVVMLGGVGALIVSTGRVGSAFALLPALLGVVSYSWTRFNRGANFRAAISPDGIRLRHGLTESRAQTVPPGRVQAVRVTQGLLWRKQDWWRVEVNVAGYGSTGDQAQTENVLLPVGTRDEALLALWLVLPDLGTADPRALVDAGLTGREADGGWAVAPRRSRWLDPVGWRRHGVTVTDRALVLRSGVLVRQLVVVPHERTQSLQLAQGPLQRRLGLASFQLHSTPGPVAPRVDHLDARVAAGLLDEQAARARTARAGAGPEQWMRRA
ncbi:PH domain-containing protein [Cellulomonas pakistanensis]|uniref:Membrane protein n=1 Tax=Cellulomonas pakistanensis TaxID=992287 RepID=A0A919PB48_9CELL|nr:PH domain-containing protein [Cellulomonas pakistanensis]GIG35392.1 membrane protein [Cellulomonas pakistanensis]